MPLLPIQESHDEDFTWMSEAIEQGLVKEGEWLIVQSIHETQSGNGFVFSVDTPNGFVYDFAYRKSSVGKVLASVFDDPTMADDNQFEVKAQKALRRAVLRVTENASLEWSLFGEESRTLVKAVKPTNGKVPAKTAPKEAKSLEAQSA